MIMPDPFWDLPDTALSACDDMFSIFLFNETSIDRLRQLGLCEDHVQGVRSAMDKAYRHERWGLMQIIMAQPPEERMKADFLRTHIPQLIYWGNGDLLDAPGRPPYA